MKDFKAIFGKRLIKCRQQLGLTQYDLAKGSHISKSFVNAVENNLRNIGYEPFLKILTFLKANWKGDEKNLLLLMDTAKKYDQMYKKNIELNVTSLPILNLEKRSIGDDYIYLFNSTDETHEVTHPVLRNEKAVNDIVFYNKVNNYCFIKIKEDNILRGIPKEALLLIEKIDITTINNLKGTYIIKLNENDYDICTIHSKENSNENFITDYNVSFQKASKNFIKNTLYSGLYKRPEKYKKLFICQEKDSKAVFTVIYKVLTIIFYVDEESTTHRL